MNYVRDGEWVIEYEGEFGSDNFHAVYIDKDEYTGTVPFDDLLEHDGPGMPWEPTPEEKEKKENYLAEQVVMQHMVKEKVAELTWKDDTQYHVGDVVYHKGKMWTSTSNNMNNEPDDVPGDWTETD